MNSWPTGDKVHLGVMIIIYKGCLHPAWTFLTLSIVRGILESIVRSGSYDRVKHSYQPPCSLERTSAISCNTFRFNKAFPRTSIQNAIDDGDRLLGLRNGLPVEVESKTFRR